MRQTFLFAIGIVALTGIGTRALGAEVRVLSDGPLELALTQVAEGFHRQSGHTVKFSFGLSPVIHKRVLDGEASDVVIVQPNFIDELIKAGKLRSDERPIVGRVGIGLFVRANAPVPDISTLPSLKKALLSADSLVFNNVASGNHFATVLDRLEIADAVKSKVTRATPSDVISHIVQGKGSDIGVGTIPLIMMDKRLTLVGPLPDDLQSYLVYAAAIATNAQSADSGREFIRYLASPDARAIFKKSGAD